MYKLRHILLIFIFNAVHVIGPITGLEAQTRTLLNHKADSILKSNPAGKEYSFVVFGDAQRWDTLHLVPEVFAEMLNEISITPSKPSFAIMLGDFVYSGTYHQYDTFYNLVSSWMDTTGIPFFCLPGNHNFTGITGYNNYLAFIDDRTDYYFDYGDNRFILINNVNSLTYSGYNITQEQTDTIAEWLNDAPPGYRFAFGHISLVRNLHQSGFANQGYSELRYILENNGVIAYFNGHIHDYHRTTYNNVYHITTAGAGGYQIGVYDPPVTYDNHHRLLINVDACKGVSLNMYRHNAGNDSIAKQYDFFIKESVPINITTQKNNVSCFGGFDGSAIVSASGGVAPGYYNYCWSNASTSALASFLQAGEYTVSVSDTTNCYATDTIIIESPDPVTTAITVADVKCAGEYNGEINLLVAGGTEPYSFNWSNGRTSQNINNLFTGIYHVTVSDFNQCEDYRSVTVNEPPIILVNPVIISDTAHMCVGSIELIVAGGVAPYSYNWPNIGINDIPSITNLCQGIYTVTVYDSNYCSITLPINIHAYWAGIDESHAVNDFTFSPNPATDNFTITTSYPLNGEIEIHLYDNIGKQVFNTTVSILNEKSLKVNITERLSGIYLLRLATKDYGSLTKKIVFY